MKENRKMKIRDEKLKSPKKKKLPIIAGSPLQKFQHVKKCKLIENKMGLITKIRPSPSAEDLLSINAVTKRPKTIYKIPKIKSENPSIINMRGSDRCNSNFKDIVQLATNTNNSQEYVSPLKSLISCDSSLRKNDVRSRKFNTSKDGGNRHSKKPIQDKCVKIKPKFNEYPSIVSSKHYTTSLLRPPKANLSGIKFYELNIAKFLVVMKPGSHLCFVGTIHLELIQGSIEIFGYNLEKERQKVCAFSLQGASNIFFKANLEKRNVINNRQLALTLSSNGLSDKHLREALKESEGTFLIISQYKEHISSTVWPLYFETHHSSSTFPPNWLFEDSTRKLHNVERRIHCLFGESLQDHGFKFFYKVPEWSDTEEDLMSQDLPKIVLCGGKSVGKSTLLRYLINKSLNKCSRVLVLDFDPGQCEFTPPGCISVTVVDQPVLGPNYTHLRQPLRSIYLGEVDVTKCPECYIEGCKYLIKYAKENHGNIPWLINTMGFTRGIGVTLNCGIILNVAPTSVVQIESKNKKINFPSRLYSGFVLSQNVDSFNTQNTSLNYQLYCVPSGSEIQAKNQQNQRGMSPAEARNLNILSYLSSMLNSKISNLSQVQPYMVGLDHIELRTVTDFNLTKAQIAATINGNMVALCEVGKEAAFPNCFGFGIVRGIDWQTNKLYLITPVAVDILHQVDCLIKGNIALPESLLYNQGPQVTGPMPYLSHTSGGRTARYVKRDFRTLPVTPREQKQ